MVPAGGCNSAFVFIFNCKFSIGFRCGRTFYKCQPCSKPITLGQLNSKYIKKTSIKMKYSSYAIDKIFLSILIVTVSHSAIAQKNARKKPLLEDAARQWQMANDLKNAKLITSLFDTSIVAIYHNNAPVYGKEENGKAWESLYSDSLNAHPVTLERVDVSKSGDMGYVLGKWWSIRPKSNYYNGGRYVAVWKLINHKWQIVMLLANVQDEVKSERRPK